MRASLVLLFAVLPLALGTATFFGFGRKEPVPEIPEGEQVDIAVVISRLGDVGVDAVPPELVSKNLRLYDHNIDETVKVVKYTLQKFKQLQDLVKRAPDFPQKSKITQEEMFKALEENSHQPFYAFRALMKKHLKSNWEFVMPPLFFDPVSAVTNSVQFVSEVMALVATKNRHQDSSNWLLDLAQVFYASGEQIQDDINEINALVRQHGIKLLPAQQQILENVPVMSEDALLEAQAYYRDHKLERDWSGLVMMVGASFIPVVGLVLGPAIGIADALGHIGASSLSDMLTEHDFTRGLTYHVTRIHRVIFSAFCYLPRQWIRGSVLTRFRSLVESLLRSVGALHQTVFDNFKQKRSELRHHTRTTWGLVGMAFAQPKHSSLIGAFQSAATFGNKNAPGTLPSGEHMQHAKIDYSIPAPKENGMIQVISSENLNFIEGIWL